MGKGRREVSPRGPLPIGQKWPLPRNLHVLPSKRTGGKGETSTGSSVDNLHSCEHSCFLTLCSLRLASLSNAVLCGGNFLSSYGMPGGVQGSNPGSLIQPACDQNGLNIAM